MKYKEKDQVLNFYMLHFILKIHGIFLNNFCSCRCSEHWRQAFPLFFFLTLSFRTKKVSGRLILFVSQDSSDNYSQIIAK